MRVLVDENIPRVTVQTLIALDHDVRDVRGTALEGCDDTRIWELAQEEARLLITTDRGFIKHRNEPHSGMLVVTLRQPSEQGIHNRIVQIMLENAELNWPGLLVLVRDKSKAVWRRSTHFG